MSNGQEISIQIAARAYEIYCCTDLTFIEIGKALGVKGKSLGDKICLLEARGLPRRSWYKLIKKMQPGERYTSRHLSDICFMAVQGVRACLSDAMQAGKVSRVKHKRKYYYSLI